jgi:hypothetical protein
MAPGGSRRFTSRFRYKGGKHLPPAANKRVMCLVMDGSPPRTDTEAPCVHPAPVGNFISLPGNIKKFEYNAHEAQAWADFASLTTLFCEAETGWKLDHSGSRDAG